MKVTIDVVGDVQVARRLTRFAGRARDASPAFETIAEFILGENERQFATQGTHASGGWKPLQPETLRRKLRKGLDPRILHATLALEHAMTRRGDRNQILEVTADGLDFGSTLPYFGAHQRPKPTSPLPQRRPVELREGARRNVVRILQRYLVTGEVTW